MMSLDSNFKILSNNPGGSTTYIFKFQLLLFRFMCNYKDFMRADGCCGSSKNYERCNHNMFTENVLH